MSRTASVETVNRGEHSCVHPTPKMIDPIFLQEYSDKHIKKTVFLQSLMLILSFIRKAHDTIRPIVYSKDFSLEEFSVWNIHNR